VPKPYKQQPGKVKRRVPKVACDPYSELVTGVVGLIEQARLAAVRSVNVVLTSTYWLAGQRIVEHEQSGSERAGYGEALLKRLAEDLTAKLGRGFSERNIRQMRLFYLGWPMPEFGRHRLPNLSRGLGSLCLGPTMSGCSPSPIPRHGNITSARHCRVAGRPAWSARQLDRQIASLAYQRTRSARSPLIKDDTLPADAHVRDPFILEFLNLKDEYSETELENALIQSLQQFLLELGNDFAFVARQKRLRVGTEWYRVDLVFFHRRLQCLIVVDLKLGKFTHADAGQMNLYLNYAREHWTHPHENPPVGLILCSERDAAVAHYALGNLANQVLAREYQLNLPNEAEIAARIDAARRMLSAAPARIEGPGERKDTK